MNSRMEVSAAEKRLFDSLIKTYTAQQAQILLFRDQLLLALSTSSTLTDLIHSIRSRLKHPDHLRDKLERMLKKCKEKGKRFDITPDNLLTKVNDLVGVRVLHLYTHQIPNVDTVLREILNENRYELI